jgi:Tol biopolymer transport system component
MTPEERYRRIDELVDRALDLEGSQRAAFLDDACGSDADLRREVDALLASHGRLGSFLEVPAFEESAKSLARAPARSLVGQRLGPYPVQALLGAGGMGEVYRAHDPRLGRDVAIKVLPAHLSADADALARFEREVRAVAALSHPSILAIHDFGTDNTIAYAVMELLDGETLRQRLAKGPIAWRKAVRIATQIADGLAAAHAKGIVHRDLKPENISIGESDQVKVLDFGLARVVPHPNALGETAGAATLPGTIVGTIGYLSPEQARGEDAGPSSDIFAFGCLVYEMLSGRAPFARNTVAESLAAVLHDDPAPLADEGREIPASLEALVFRCLEKRVADRFQSASDLAFALKSVGSATGRLRAARIGTSARRRRWIALAAIGIALITIAAGAMVWGRATPAVATTAHLSLPIADELRLVPNDSPSAGSSIAISADGHWIAFVVVRAGERYIALREISRPDIAILPGTEGALTPMFSPESRWIAFFTETDLRKIPLAGGTPTIISRVPPVARGGAWAEDDRIYFSPSFSQGLQQVAAAGGTPADVTTVDLPAGEGNHLLPDVLPGAAAVLFTVWKGGDFSTASIWSVSLATGERRLLIVAASAPRYVPPGFLVFARGGGLFAIRFDAQRLTTSGEAVPVVDGVWTDRTSGTAHYAVSRDGTLVYAAGGETVERRRLAWVDRRGQIERVPADVGFYANPRMSPDGRRLVVEALNDLWIYDLQNATFNRVTFRGVNQHAVWSPDGRRLALSSSHGTPLPTVFWADADGGGAFEPIGRGGGVQFPASWTSTGNVLAYARHPGSWPDTERGGWDIWTFHPGTATPDERLTATPFNEDQPIFSPDGRALAYVSDETGKRDVYVRAYPSLGRRTRISVEGGTEPVWARDGRELFFRNGRRYYSAAIAWSGGEIRVSRPVLMFEGDFVLASLIPGFPSYDVAPDGRRFIVVAAASDSPQIARLEVVLGWSRLLEDRVSRQTAK